MKHPDVPPLPGREQHPHSFEDTNGLVHLGETALRLDGASDWPWMDCYANSAFMYWVDKPPSCMWCITRQERPETLQGPWPPKRDPWVSG